MQTSEQLAQTYLAMDQSAEVDAREIKRCTRSFKSVIRHLCFGACSQHACHRYSAASCVTGKQPSHERDKRVQQRRKGVPTDCAALRSDHTGSCVLVGTVPKLSQNDIPIHTRHVLVSVIEPRDMTRVRKA